MQLIMMTSAVLSALLTPHSATTPAAPASAQPASVVSPAALPPVSPCPAYLGPQCDSVQHEQIATGQSIAALGLGR